ncbi:MAG TPA: hypothetical protein VJ792_09935 [Candidatus Nitrosotalea sp.]|nr:hypothetical protein [Candidatus Nitrosotalea sp.]
MKKTLYLLLILSFVAGITIGSSHVTAQQASIPSWVKKTALWWGQDQISDAEFVKAIQWMVDNGIIRVSTGGQATQPPQQETTQPGLFSPCPEVDLKSPSSCLAKYLPAPTDIGTQWSSHNGISIPTGVSSPVLTQLVQEDFENLNAKPLEIFDVWIEEYQPAEKGQEVFKTDEQTMEKGATKFFGSSQTNDTSFICICPDGSGGTSYHSEFVAGSVVVKVDGMGDAKNVISDMSTINQSIIGKISQAH